VVEQAADGRDDPPERAAGRAVRHGGAERALFSYIHYLALIAEPDVLAGRLAARPAWRE